jgi:hypothetical protein
MINRAVEAEVLRLHHAEFWVQFMPHIAYTCEIWHSTPRETGHLDGRQQGRRSTVSRNSAGCSGV